MDDTLEKARPDEATNRNEDLAGELQEILDTSASEREHEARFVERAQQVGQHVDATPEAIAAFYGTPPAEAEGILADAELTRPSMRVAHRMSGSSFRSLLEDGAFKNYEETGHSGGKGGKVDESGSYGFERRKYEETYGLRLPGEPPLIHGYLVDTNTLGERGTAFTYGAFEVILKPELIERSVFTPGDSALTGAKPLDSGSGLIAEAVRGRMKQRLRTGSLAESYTEAIMLGGVTLDDVEGVAITIGGLQSGERQSESLSPQNLDEATSWIDQVHQVAPGLKLTIRIPADGLFPTGQALGLAQKYPYVQFMATIQDVGDLGVQSPFRDLGTPEYEKNIEAKFRDQVRTAGLQSYERATERRDHLVQRAGERWAAKGHDGQPPSNLSFHLTNLRH